MKKLKKIKETIIEMIYNAGVSHVGSALSVVDILYTLYYKVADITSENIKTQNHDKIILSKGHASAALYSVLYHKGFISKEKIEGYAVNNGTLPCHVDKETSPFFECAAGSLGHGFGIATGLAFADKLDKRKNRTFVILGDGECEEGSVWEAAMFCSTHKLNNLTVIIDYNELQAFGRTNEIINQTNLSERFKAFGFETFEVDGHDIEALEKTLNLKTDKPLAIIAHTIKGKGISFMENNLLWHYKSPNEEQYNLAIKEIEEKYQ